MVLPTLLPSLLQESPRELMLEVTVLGIPQPQGSKTVYAGRAVDANAKKLKPWRKQVTAAVRDQLGDWQLTADPISVKLQFLMPRPRTVTRDYPTVKPDLDKLIRAILDGVTDVTDRDAGIGVWVDDSQVINLKASKRYANDLPPQVIVSIERANHVY